MVDVTDDQIRAVVNGACDWLETRQFAARMLGGAEYGDDERHYLEGWRDGYFRAVQLLRSQAAVVVIPDDAAEIIDGTAEVVDET